MTINFKTNVKTVIRYKGQEYSSANELPPEARAAYEAVLAGGTSVTTAPGLKQQILVNGQHFGSLEEMPAGERKLYDDAIAFVRESGTLPTTATASPSWLTPAQWRVVFIIAAIALSVVIVHLLH